MIQTKVEKLAERIVVALESMNNHNEKMMKLISCLLRSDIVRTQIDSRLYIEILKILRS